MEKFAINNLAFLKWNSKTDSFIILEVLQLQFFLKV